MINRKIYFSTDESDGKIKPDRALSEMLDRAASDAEDSEELLNLADNPKALLEDYQEDEVKSDKLNSLILKMILHMVMMISKY